MNKQELPIAHQDKINFAVKHGLGYDTWELACLLSGGLTGIPVYQIQVSDKYYAIKLEDINNEQFDLIENYKIIATASEQGICPRAYFLDAKRGIVLMDYIHAKPAEPSAENIQKFAELIRKLHDGNEFKPWKTVMDVLKENYQKLPNEYKNNDYIAQCLTQIKKIQPVLFDPADRRPCHADLNPANVLFDGFHYFLVDWQAASNQSFYYDLACVATWFYFYSENLCGLFLQSYFGHETTEVEQAKYYLMRIFTPIYFGIGFMALSLKTNFEGPILEEEEVKKLPNFLTFMQAVGARQMNLMDSKIQQQFGFVFLKTAKTLMNDKFTHAYEFLLNRISHER